MKNQLSVSLFFFNYFFSRRLAFCQTRHKFYSNPQIDPCNFDLALISYLTKKKNFDSVFNSIDFDHHVIFNLNLWLCGCLETTSLRTGISMGRWSTIRTLCRYINPILVEYIFIVSTPRFPPLHLIQATDAWELATKYVCPLTTYSKTVSTFCPYPLIHSL